MAGCVPGWIVAGHHRLHCGVRDGSGFGSGPCCPVGVECRSLPVGGCRDHWAAWALAHAGADRIVLPSGEEKAALVDLPIAALRLDAGTVSGLRRLGLRAVRDLLRIPRAQIASRFGALPVLRLDQSFGAVEEAIDWPRSPIEWDERLAFAEPIGTPEDLARSLLRLAEGVPWRLAEQGRGGRRFGAVLPCR